MLSTSCRYLLSYPLCTDVVTHKSLKGEKKISISQSPLLLGFLAVIGFANQRHFREHRKVVWKLSIYESIAWWEGFG